MDTLIALTAEHHGLTVLHVDDDFAAFIKARPGIPMIRLQPRTNDGPHSRCQTADASRAEEAQPRSGAGAC
ncbi:hypothetical protein [Streptomyces sp. NBC_00271]|uniref:hypothetical protein n=1 Tax=Streptomyces sp. NBC_00271 TaxID=2975697 RepID=UPI0032447FDC